MKLSKSQKKELDRRLRDYQSGKGKTYTWDEVISITDQALKAKIEMLKLSDADIAAGRLTSRKGR